MYHQEVSVILDTPIETQHPATDREESLVFFHPSRMASSSAEPSDLFIMLQ